MTNTRKTTKAPPEEVPDDGGDVISILSAGLMEDPPHRQDTDLQAEAAVQGGAAGGALIEQEVAQTGNVKPEVYWYYMKNMGFVGSIVVILMHVVYQGCSLGTNYWLSIWTDNKLGNASEPRYRDLYIGVYGALGAGQAVSVMVLTVGLAFCTLKASRKMHTHMLLKVMRSPMTFFDTTPTGRVVNRFAKDIDVCDNTLPSNVRQWLSTFVNFLGTIVIIISVIPLFTVVILPTAAVFYFVQKVYVSSSRQLKRLESISRSPIYSHFGETISGSSTIRAFGKEAQFVRISEDKVDFNQKCYYPSIVANRWLAILLENLGNLITFGAAMIAVSDTGAIKASEVGLIISYALNVTAVLNWLVRMTADVETNIVAVERVKEYSSLPEEAPWEIAPATSGGGAGTGEAAKWPHEGRIKFSDFRMRYREGLDLVLNSLSFDVKGGEKVGIVGRTGAGKSSLTMALFRLVEAAGGEIVIDGKDTALLGLHEVRKSITIIPQDPVLFSGTLRLNLDPFEAYEDASVWQALKLSHLYDFVSGLEAGLQHPIAEGGDNLSVGQRQLVCLARALLKKTKILVLDEATAAVDLETDELIQGTIRQEFRDSTVLTIAHRLNTIMDYDKILVMDKGRLAEFDSVQNLLTKENGIFYSMVKKAGLLPNKP